MQRTLQVTYLVLQNLQIYRKYTEQKPENWIFMIDISLLKEKKEKVLE